MPQAAIRFSNCLAPAADHNITLVRAANTGGTTETAIGAPAEIARYQLLLDRGRKRAKEGEQASANAANLDADLEFGKWIEKMFEEGEKFCELVYAKHSPESLRSTFPGFFNGVIKPLPAVKCQRFLEDATRRTMSKDDLAEVIGFVKGKSGSRILDLRQDYRRRTRPPENTP